MSKKLTRETLCDMLAMTFNEGYKEAIDTLSNYNKEVGVDIGISKAILVLKSIPIDTDTMVETMMKYLGEKEA